MFEFVKNGDIFASGADLLVNPVNTVGVMGAGLARQFRERFLSNFTQYVAQCQSRTLRVGTVTTNLDSGVAIANFPTKGHWRDSSTLDIVTTGLDVLAKNLPQNQYRVVAIPKLGCGLGGLDWNDVKPLILTALKDLKNVNSEEIRFLIYE